MLMKCVIALSINVCTRCLSTFVHVYLRQFLMLFDRLGMLDVPSICEVLFAVKIGQILNSLNKHVPEKEILIKSHSRKSFNQIYALNIIIITIIIMIIIIIIIMKSLLKLVKEKTGSQS